MKDINTKTKELSDSEFNMAGASFALSGGSHISFSFTGPEKTVKRMIREFLWGGVIKSGIYTKDNGDFPLQINFNQFDDLVNMFWYIEKRLGTNYLGLFPQMHDVAKEFITYKKNGETVYAPISHLLNAAINIAHERQDEPLVIHEPVESKEILEHKNKSPSSPDHEPMLPNEFDFDLDESIGSALKKIAHSDFFQAAVLKYEKYFLELHNNRYANNLTDISTLLEPRKHKQLFVLAALLGNGNREKDKPLFKKIINYLINNNFLPAITVGIEGASRDTFFDGKDKLNILIDLLTRASNLGDAEASCCLAKLYMGMIRTAEYLHFPRTFEITSQEPRLQIDMKKAIHYLDLSEKQGFSIAYLSAAYDLAKINFESAPWKSIDIQHAISIMKRGYALPTEETIKKDIAAKLEHLGFHDIASTSSSSEKKAYYAVPLLFWQEKAADTKASIRPPQSLKTDTCDIPSDTIEKTFSFWKRIDKEANTSIAPDFISNKSSIC